MERGVKQTLVHVEKQNLPAQMHVYLVKQKIVRIVKQNFMMVVVMKKKLTNNLFLLFIIQVPRSIIIITLHTFWIE